jgi:hypothetical protein
MSSERQVYVLYSVESSSRILLPKVFGQCDAKDGWKLHLDGYCVLVQRWMARWTLVVRTYRWRFQHNAY